MIIVALWVVLVFRAIVLLLKGLARIDKEIGFFPLKLVKGCKSTIYYCLIAKH